MTILTDNKISLQAKGIYACIASLEDSDTTINVHVLADMTSSSRYIIYNALKELIDNGYIKKSNLQTADSRGQHTIIYSCIK